MPQLPEAPPTLAERLWIERECDRSAEFRELVRQRCQDDAAWFINAFGFTFDPRPTAPLPDLPFTLFPFQIEMIHWLDERIVKLEDGILEKSRDMGATWVILAWITHKWLFGSGFQALVGSRKEDLVDNGTLDSHFGKMTYFLDQLPGWLKPKGYNKKFHRRKLKLVNPTNGNVVIGESMNPDFSRQGRYSVIFFDEAAFWEDLSSSWRAAAQAATTRILASTANGMNTFGRLRHEKLPDGRLKFPVLTLHWTLDPRKGAEWYKLQQSRMSDEELAQEVDISYQRSIFGTVYPGWSEVPKGVYPFESRMQLYTSWDFGVSDDTAIIWWGKNPLTGKVRIVDCYHNRGKPIDFYAPFVTGIYPKEDYIEEVEDDSGHKTAIKKWREKYAYTSDERRLIGEHASWGSSINFGDPSGKQRSGPTATSVIYELAALGIHIHTNDKARDFRSRKVATELGLRQIEGWNEERCQPLNDAIQNYQFAAINPDSRSISTNDTPIHNWASHYATAVEYFFVNATHVLTSATQRPEAYVPQMIYDVAI